jgi:hypothetical protein
LLFGGDKALHRPRGREPRRAHAERDPRWHRRGCRRWHRARFAVLKLNDSAAKPVARRALLRERTHQARVSGLDVADL